MRAWTRVVDLAHRVAGRLGRMPHDEDLAKERREAVDHAADVATRVTRQMENPRVRLIVQSADDLGASFGPRRR